MPNLNFRAFATAFVIAVPFVASALPAFAQCSISPSPAVIAADWDRVFTQDGPGKGLEPDGSPGWTGGDSTYSLLLPDGETAFFFSDSYIGESPSVKGDGTVTQNANGLRTTAINCPPPLCDPEASSFVARNSIVLRSKDGKTLRTLVGPKNKDGLSTSYFKDPGKGINYWIGDAIILAVGGKEKVLIFLLKFDPKLEFHGASIAQLDAKTLVIEKQLDVKGLPDLETHWGGSLIVDGRQLYIYGTRSVKGQKLAYVSRTIAATELENLADTTRWEVWNGSKWIKGLFNAKAIVPSTDSISDEVDVARVTINGRPTYLMVAMDTSVPFGSWRDITLYSSCSPEGPFTGKHKVYEMPESNSSTVPGLEENQKLKGHLVVYNPHIHAQFSGSGQLLISYNLNRTHNSDSIFIDGYRPRFIRVPIARLKNSQ